jgi:hypothetical protein
MSFEEFRSATVRATTEALQHNQSVIRSVWKLVQPCNLDDTPDDQGNLTVEVQPAFTLHRSRSGHRCLFGAGCYR